MNHAGVFSGQAANNESQTNNYREQGTNSGTLMWIGDRSTAEFRAAYSFCESNAAQLAYRTDLHHALCRPASSVRCILVAQATRAAYNASQLDELSAKYTDALWINLQSSLCEGARTPAHFLFDGNQHYWHRWNQVLPNWLAPCGAQPIPRDRPSHSVAIVASNRSAGDALMELAESAGVTTVWCGDGNITGVKNVDAVWWDDSVAKPTSSRIWSQRIEAFQSTSRQTQHAWIANSPRLHQTKAATEGGVDFVVSKPYRIEVLLESLESKSQNRNAMPKIARAA